MPLSKKRNKERMRQSRVQPNTMRVVAYDGNGEEHVAYVISPLVQPNISLLDAVSPSIKREGYGKASSTVQPKFEPLPNCPDGGYRKGCA